MCPPGNTACRLSAAGAEHPEHRNLCRGIREVEILSTVDHQHGRLHVRREVEWIDLRRKIPGFEATRHQHACLQARFDRQKQRTELRTETESVRCDLRGINVTARLEIVDRS